MTRTRIAALVVSLIMLTGCAELLNTLKTVSAVKQLTEADIIAGLREALSVGARNAGGRLALQDGYWGDPEVRIPLPEEAKAIVENIGKIPGGQQLIDNVLLSINRAAEDAARDVAPIFVNSVMQMTITDGYNILHGADNAATVYLKNTTWNGLYDLSAHQPARRLWQVSQHRIHGTPLRISGIRWPTVWQEGWPDSNR